MRQKIELKKHITTKTFQEGYQEYINYCRIRNLRPATLIHNDRIIKSVWYKFISPETPIKNITNSVFDSFIMFCKNKTNENDVSINTNIRSIMEYFVLFHEIRLHERI